MLQSVAVARSQDRELPASKPKLDGRIRYGCPWVSAASALPLEGNAIRPRRIARFTAAAVRRPRRFAALIMLLVRTPRAYVVLSGSAAGQALYKYFNRRLLGVVPSTRFCQGVLLLPNNHADYLRGRRRQALRTNLRRAAAAGIHCEVVTDPRRAVDDVSRVWWRQSNRLSEAEFQVRLNAVRAAITRSEVTIAVARDEHDCPVAMAAVLIDDMVCLIECAVATSHGARWALHDHLVRILIERRVRYLLADGGGPFGALGFTTNVQHFQHLLGYELRHMVAVTSARPTPWRRLIAALVLVAP